MKLCLIIQKLWLLDIMSEIESILLFLMIQVKKNLNNLYKKLDNETKIKNGLEFYEIIIKWEWIKEEI